MTEGAASAEGVAAPPLGTLRQLAWVVNDIEAAMAHWSRALGVGPWFYKPKVGVTQFRHLGREAATAAALPDLAIAFANSGALQLELIEQRNDAPSMYRDFLLRHGAGMQHVAFWTEQFDAQVQQLLDAGYTEGHAGRVGERGRFGYYVHAAMPGTVIEVSEQTGGKAEFFRQVREAAVGWDGRDPVRRVD